MNEKLPNIEDLGEDFWNSCTEDPDEAFFNEKATEIIDNISDEKYIEILSMSGIEDAQDELGNKNVETLASSLMMAYSLCDECISAEEFYISLNI